MDVEHWDISCNRDKWGSDMPRRSIWIALIVLRSLQVVLGVASSIHSVICLLAAAALSSVFSSEYAYLGYFLLVPTPVYVLASLLTLALSITFLVFTARPKSRVKATSCGNHAPYMNYTCDFSWDLALACLWFIVFLVSAIFIAFVGAIVMAVFACALYIATSVLTGLVRRRFVQAARNRPGGVQLGGHVVAAADVECACAPDIEPPKSSSSVASSLPQEYGYPVVHVAPTVAKAAC